jgi:DNA-binding transcriptional ArsR family regulator
MHLLAVLGELSDFDVGQGVKMEATFGPVCARIGVKEDQFGTSAHGTLQTHRSISLAMRSMRDRGLTDYVRKGVWRLTPTGVSCLHRTQDGIAVEVDAKAMSEAVPLMLDDNPYADPYIRSLAVVRTPCFGGWLPANKVCAACRLAPVCVEARWLHKAEIAAEILAEEKTDAHARATMAKKSAKIDSSVAELIQTIQDLGGHVRGSPQKPYRLGHGETTREAVIDLDSLCEHCGGQMPAKSRALWIKSKGIFHPGCVFQPTGVEVKT